jgi:hypothetical protein
MKYIATFCLLFFYSINANSEWESKNVSDDFTDKTQGIAVTEATKHSLAKNKHPFLGIKCNNGSVQFVINGGSFGPDRDQDGLVRFDEEDPHKIEYRTLPSGKALAFFYPVNALATNKEYLAQKNSIRMLNNIKKHRTIKVRLNNTPKGIVDLQFSLSGSSTEIAKICSNF